MRNWAAREAAMASQLTEAMAKCEAVEGARLLLVAELAAARTAVATSAAREGASVKALRAEIAKMAAAAAKAFDAARMEALSQAAAAVAARADAEAASAVAIAARDDAATARAGAAAFATEERARATECVICLTNQRNVLFKDCRHIVSCEECFKTQKKSVTGKYVGCPCAGRTSAQTRISGSSYHKRTGNDREYVARALKIMFVVI